MLDKQEIASHSHSHIHDDLSQMHPKEDFIHSSLSWIFEVIHERKNKLMINIAEDDRGQSLHLFAEHVPSSYTP